MAYELLALDIDGTITDSNRKLPDAVKQGLIDIQKAGKMIILATGRADSGVASLVKELEMDKYGSYVATYNGAKLRQCDTNEIICNLTFPQEMIRPVFEVVRCYPEVDMITVTADAMYSGLHINKYSELESGICGFPITHLDDLPSEITFPVNAFLVTGEPTTLVTVCAQLNMIFSSVLDVYLSDPYFLEVMPKNISKASSLDVLLKHLGLTTDNLIACGDGQNDISMIEFAGLGVAMENASDKVKKSADYVTLSNDENGVLHVIEKFMMEKNYEIIVLDLDGTLLDSAKNISPATRQALIDIQEAGKKVVLASGRSEHGVVSYAEELELGKYGSFILSYNGCRIRQCATDELIYNLTIPNEIIAPIFDIVKEYPDVDLGIDTVDTYYYGICKNPYNELESGLCDIPLVYLEDLPNAVDFPVNALLITGEPDTLVAIEKRLQDIYGDQYGVFRSEPFYLRVMPPNVDKAQSLQRLLLHMGLTREEMICCGDGYNDKSMIEFAGLGVAMENAKPETKDAANFITKSNDDEGVLYVVERFMR